MSGSLFDVLGGQLSLFFGPVTDAVEHPQLLTYLLQELGSSPNDSARAKLVAALQPIAGFVQSVESMLAKPSPGLADIGALLTAGEQAFQAIRTLDTSADLAAEFGGIGEDLLDLLLGTYIAQQAPLTYRFLVLLTVIDAPDEVTPTAAVVANGATVRGPVELPRFHPDRLVALFQDPLKLLKSQYLTPLQTDDDAAAMADKLFPRIAAILTDLQVPNKYGLLPEEAALLGDAAAFMNHALTVYVAEQLGGANFDAGFHFAISPASRGNLGLVISPFGDVQYTATSGNVSYELDFTAQLDAVAIGPLGVTIAASVATVDVSGKFLAKLAPPDGTPAGTPAFLLGAPTGTRLELGGGQFEIDLSFTGGAFEAAVSAGVSKSSVVLAPGDGDGFLSSVLPAKGLTVNFDFGISWSNTAGLAFHGAAGLDAALPIGINIAGTLSIPVLYLAIRAANSQIATEASIQASLSIGPISATVDRIGIAAVLNFPSGGGNLGIGDLDFRFKPPSGVGLNVDAAGVTGGGYLGYNDAAHEYFGVLQLRFTDLALQAFGLITTQVAGGAGYSLLALVDANFPPVPLGWGFTLNGVGGIFAMHRTAAVDALRAAIKADALATLLFPKNAITSAPQILAQIETLFPTAPGRFLFGPMALIGWGTPTVMTVALAVILELPEPITILLLARVAVRAPSESAALVRINMDALGVLDLSHDALALDAVLYDSRLMSFTLSGAMALRANWGSQREFLLAIGGFHPQFTPPADFPSLERITINMPSGIVSKLRLSAYLALTSNTVQFGAELDVFVGADGFGLSGQLGFDALFQLDPFHFDAHLAGSVSIQFAGEDLASVSFDGDLSGPAPWHIAGSFKIHVVFWDVHKSFSHSWGSDAPSQTVATVDVLGLLSATLADPRSWVARLPAGTGALVTMRGGAQGNGAVVAHPLGLPEVHERIVPLDMDITRFGAAAPAGATRYTITDWRLGGVAAPQEPVADDFAPAQFLDLSDDEKLARPSYEQHAAGVKMSAGVVKSGTAVAKTLAYETSYIDVPGGAPRTDPVPTPPLAAVLGILALGASGRAQAQAAPYWAAGNPVVVMDPQFVLVGTDTLAAVGIGPAAGASYSEVAAMLAAELLRAPGRRGTLQIVATHERMAA